MSTTVAILIHSFFHRLFNNTVPTAGVNVIKW